MRRLTLDLRLNSNILTACCLHRFEKKFIFCWLDISLCSVTKKINKKHELRKCAGSNYLIFNSDDEK